MATILHVEDDPLGAELVRRILKRRPAIEVVSASTGAAALSLVTEHDVQLVLLDMRLPDASGVEILERLRADPTTVNLPVVVLSGDTSSSAALAAGASDYLVKPCDMAQLLAMVDRYVPPETGTP
jgi:CheY-like chemotaxis protein